MVNVVIKPFDVSEATEAEMREVYDLSVAIDLELDPDDTHAPFEQWARERREFPSWVKPLRWSARTGDALVGFGYLGLQYTESNRHLAEFNLNVDRDHRGQGIGTQLLERIVTAATEDGRTMLGASAEDGSPGEAFLDRLGMEKRLVDRRSRLLVKEVDDALLDEWVKAAADRAAGYSLLVWDSGAPEEHLEAFVELDHVMNTAPRDDLEMEDWVNTPERQREHDKRARDQGYRWWTMVVQHDATGDLVGFTELRFTPYEHDIAWQWGTGVDPAHRNHGIGRWLKAAMLQKLRAERPEVWRIDTWNAGSNKTMLGINVALGFRPLKHYGSFQASTERLAASVAQRLGR